jgi:hypothetical protein
MEIPSGEIRFGDEWRLKVVEEPSGHDGGLARPKRPFPMPFHLAVHERAAADRLAVGVVGRPRPVVDGCAACVALDLALQADGAVGESLDKDLTPGRWRLAFGRSRFDRGRLRRRRGLLPSRYPLGAMHQYADPRATATWDTSCDDENGALGTAGR